MAIRILLYEDNEALRNSLSALIDFSENLELLAAFENCKNVVEHLSCYQPDIVLSDIDMPEVNGIQGLKEIRAVNETIPVIMLTIFDDNEHVIEAIVHGATGYLLKQNIATHLGSAIKEALQGGAPMSPIVASMVLKYISDQKKPQHSYSLTKREKDILQSLTDGNSYKMVANNLGISMGTVTSHIKNIYEKLGVHSQAEAVSKTLRERIL